MNPLILASSSPYRKALLQRLQIPFECVSPEVEEIASDGEAPAELALRLAQEKCLAVHRQFPDRTVVGSDQVASLGGEILGKPGSFARAREQLQASSGRRVEFHTALCVSHSGSLYEICEPFAVQFRTLSAEEIEAYLKADEPYDCAGSFKWESLGISLFESMIGEDPTALEGLPLIRLCSILREIGLDPLRPAPATPAERQ